MARIEYSAINPGSIAFINSDEFRSVLTANPNLRLVTVGEHDEDGNELIVDVALPLAKNHHANVAVMDTDGLMWVLHYSYCIVKNPSPAFIEVLKVMDAYSVKTWQERIYSREGQFAWLYIGKADILAAEFDFANGEYML
jgi:hypothetical protein